jgi:hypothetical protein
MTQGEYAEKSWQDETKSKRWQYWNALHAVRSEYRQAVGDNAEMKGPTLPHWVEQKYGIKMGLDGQGNYTQHYDVVDPKRFLFFQIKYMK